MKVKGNSFHANIVWGLSGMKEDYKYAKHNAMSGLKCLPAVL